MNYHNKINGLKKENLEGDDSLKSIMGVVILTCTIGNVTTILFFEFWIVRKNEK